MSKRTAVLWFVVILLVCLNIFVRASGDGDISVSRLVSEEEYEIIERYRRLEEVRETLAEEYYIPVDEETLITGAIRGMMDAVDDPYTFYYTPEEMAESNEQTEGVYHGVGMLVQLSEGYIEIVRVYADSPAEKAGLMAGDKIIAVDGTPVSGENGKTLDDAVSLIKGEDGTAVSITVLRDGGEVTVEAIRAAVNISHIEYHILDGNVGYISILQFTGDDVTGFQEARSAFESAGVAGMVVDLRSNPGGLLTDVVAISDMVLPEGLVTYVEDRHGNRYEETSDAEYWDIPMVVLVNGMSASASELFTAAIQDYDRGTVVGTTTFGKGIVQTLITFSEDGAGMQYTTASYYSPNGRTIHGTGVEPDVVAELSEDYDPSILTPDPSNDNQLAVALEELEKLVEGSASAE